MNVLTHEFTAAQRQTLDRYTRFLGTLNPVFDTIPAVFQRRRNNGHQLTALARDSRLGDARFNERYLQALATCAENVRQLCAARGDELALFAEETMAIIRQSSRHEPVDSVDFRRYSLSRSTDWRWFPPASVRDLVHELTLRLHELGAEAKQLKYTLTELRNESFGLKAVFSGAMAHRTCQCHAQPNVSQELFREGATAPVWAFAYSSQDPSVRAEEYCADIMALFRDFATVSAQMGLFVETLHQRIDHSINELYGMSAATRLSELRFRLETVVEGITECRSLLDRFEAWLRP